VATRRTGVSHQVAACRAAAYRGRMVMRQETSQGSYVESGKEYTRDTQYIETRITRDGRDGYPVEPGAIGWLRREPARGPIA